jgi:site-specific DNA-methyltransferase (adenine-specific)
LYYHCDWHASHYVKVMLDQLFVKESLFQGEIVWRRTNARQDRRRWCRMHDVIFFYTKGDSYRFEPLMVRGDDAKMPHTLVTGPDGKKYNTSDLMGQGITEEGESGRPWRGYDPNKYGI